MSSAVDPPHIVNFLNAGTYDVFRRYLDNFGPSLDLNDLENSTKTPGYIVSGDVVEKFPPAYHSSGFYNCVFLIQPESFSEHLRIIVKTRTPQHLEQIDKKSFLAVFNPKYFLGPIGRKSFSLGPERFLLWFSRVPLKASKKRSATSPVKGSFSAPKNLKLSPRKGHIGLPGALSSGAAKDVDRMPPPPSWFDVSRKRHNHPLDISGETSSSRPCGHSLCSHTRHCANSACADHRHCGPVQQVSCCGVAQHNSCCSRQCYSHSRSSGCHTCHHGAPPPCSTQAHFGSCHSGCGSRCCNDSRELDHHGCCSKHHIQEAPPRALCDYTGHCQRPGPSRSTEQLESPISERAASGNSRADHGWFVQNWVKQSTIENERAASVVAPNHIIATQDTQATFGDSFPVVDDDDHFTSVSEYLTNPKRVGATSAVQEEVESPRHALPSKTQKRTRSSQASGQQGVFLQDFSNAEHMSTTSQAKSTGAAAEPVSQIVADHGKTAVEKDRAPRPHPRNLERHSQQACGQESSKSNPVSKNSQVPQADALQKRKISLTSADHRRSGQQGHRTRVQGRDRPEVRAHCSKETASHVPLHQVRPKTRHPPGHEKLQPVSSFRKEDCALDSDADSSDSDTSSMFYGKTQSLLLEGARNTSKQSEAHKTQNLDLNKTIVLNSSSGDEENGAEVEHEEQPEQQEIASPEIASDTQLTNRDTLEPPQMNPQSTSRQVGIFVPIEVQRKKTVRRLFNPSNSSWYFDPSDPAESALCEKRSNERANVCLETVDLTTQDSVTKSADGVTVSEKGSSLAGEKLPKSVDRSSEPVVESTSQDTDEEIIPPSDAETAMQGGVIPPSDAEMPDKAEQKPSGHGTNETVDQILAFVEEWYSDSTHDTGPCVTPTKCATELLRDLLGEKDSPSHVSFLGNSSEKLNAFTHLHLSPIAALNVSSSTRNQNVTHTDKAADHADQPSDQERAINHTAVETITDEQSNEQKKVVSDSGSEVPSSQPQPLHDNTMCETLYVKNLSTSDAHGDVSVDMSRTICGKAVDDSVGTSRMSLKLCEQNPPGAEESSVSEDAGSRSSVSLELEESEVRDSQGQGDGGVENEGSHDISDKTDRDVAEPVAQETTAGGTGPSNTGNNQSAPHKPPGPTPDPPASQTSSDLNLQITDSGSSQSAGANKPHSDVTDEVSKKPDPPASQISSDLNLQITDSCSSQPAGANKPHSDVTDAVAKKPEPTSRRSPDSTTEHLSEELLNLEPPCSPASTIFYDAQALQDEEEFSEEETKNTIQPHPKESAKASPSSVENTDVSHKLTLAGQVFGVQVTIVDMKPSITLENRMDIVKAICLSGCQSKFEYEKVTKEKTMFRTCLKCSYRRHHICPTCKKTGEKRALCLQFRFEVHALIGSHKCLRLQVEHEDALNFLGTDVKKYLRQDSPALQTVRALQNLSDSPDQRKRRLQGQAFIRTEDRDGEVVPFLTDTQLSDFKLSKNLI